MDGDAVVHAGWLVAGGAAGAGRDGAEGRERRGTGEDVGADEPLDGPDPGRVAGTDDGRGGGDGSDADAIAAGIGTRLGQARAARGISQQRLARLIGVERPTVCRWERGARMPSIPALLRTAAALAVPPAALLPEPAANGVAPGGAEDDAHRAAAQEAPPDPGAGGG